MTDGKECLFMTSSRKDRKGGVELLPPLDTSLYSNHESGSFLLFRKLGTKAPNKALKIMLMEEAREKVNAKRRRASHHRINSLSRNYGDFSRTYSKVMNTVIVNKNTGTFVLTQCEHQNSNCTPLLPRIQPSDSNFEYFGQEPICPSPNITTNQRSKKLPTFGRTLRRHLRHQSTIDYSRESLEKLVFSDTSKYNPKPQEMVETYAKNMAKMLLLQSNGSLKYRSPVPFS